MLTKFSKPKSMKRKENLRTAKSLFCSRDGQSAYRIHHYDLEGNGFLGKCASEDALGDCSGVSVLQMW